MTTMDITIHGSFLPHNDPDASLAFYRDTLGFEVRNDVGYGGMRWITVGPAGQPDTSIVLEPPAADPGVTDDERRTILEMMAKAATPASSWPPPTSTAPSCGCRPAAPTSSRSRRSSRTGFATARSAIPRAT
jgi:catechol 2,3-dioxygenase-like lactoylglutathione lyase family enzyme